MEDSYISNIQEDDQILDSDLLEKIHQLEAENETLKLKLSEGDKKIISQKHQIENMEIEFSNKNNTIKSLEGLIQFYQQEKGSNKEEENINKYQEYEDKIKNLEESITIKNQKIEQIKQDLNEQYSVNEKLINALTEKEEINKNKKDDDDLSDNSDDSNENNKANDIKKLGLLQDKIEELEEIIIDLNKDKENITDKYEEKIQEINKENNDYQEKIYELQNEIKEINKQLEMEKIKKMMMI